jgi:Ribbon-helix-helix protein, copG family
VRTTLTLDDDVAAALDRLRRARGATLRTLVNEVLREGLRQMRARPARGAPFRTQSVDLGRPRCGGLDNVADALAIAEGEGFR